MLPLGGDRFPSDAAELAADLRTALLQLVTLPDGASAVEVAGGTYPDADLLRIDLTGAAVAPKGPPPDAASAGPTEPGPSFRRLEFLAHPLRVGQAAVHFDLSAGDVRFAFGRNKAGQPLLVLESARDGQVEARANRQEAEAALLARLGELAREKGVEIERTELKLDQTGPRSLRLDAKVYVRKKVLVQSIRGAVSVAGRLDIDDALVARLSDLAIEGEGVIVSVVVGLVRSRVKALEGQAFPLTAVSLGAVRLRDVQLHVGDELRVTAAFGA